MSRDFVLLIPTALLECLTKWIALVMGTLKYLLIEWMNEVQVVSETKQLSTYICEFWTSLKFLLHFCKALLVRTALFTNWIFALDYKAAPWGSVLYQAGAFPRELCVFTPDAQAWKATSSIHESGSFSWKQPLTLEGLPGNPKCWECFVNKDF